MTEVTSTTYTPVLPDLSGITLPSELAPLVEEQAELVHDTWATQRIGKGWTLGEKRDDDKLYHPDLRPYDELSHDDQQYDRNTAEATMKFLILKGYKITKRNDE